MIHSVDLSSNEVLVGQSITIEIEADSDIRVSIGCFVDKPPPPRFKGCAECSVQVVQSGQPFRLTPGRDTWRTDGGGYRIVATSSDGDSRTVIVRVLRGAAGASGAQMGA